MSSLVKISLKHSSRINYILTRTGEPGTVISTNQKLLLSVGRVYQIPVDTKANLDDHNVFKTLGKLQESLDVRNVRDGFAFIHPIVHNVLITNEQELGSFI